MKQQLHKPGVMKVKENKKMMIIKDIKTLAALLMAGVAFTACSTSSDDIITEQPVQLTEPQVYTMVIKASKGGASRGQNGTRSCSAEAQPALGEAKASSATTRALSYDSDTKALNATWETGERVFVYNDNVDEVLGGYLEAKSDGATVTLEGELTGTVNDGDGLYLRFPQLNVDYTGQDGTLATIASKYDYAEGHARVTGVNGGKITAGDYQTDGPVQFENQQAIVKFTLLNKADDSAINATSLIIEAKKDSKARLMQTFDTDGPIDITPSPATNEIYAALCPYYSNGSYDYTLTATDEDGFTYTYTKADVNFEWGKFYSITVKMEKQRKDLSMADCAGKLRSTMSTANCYMVHKAGQYKLPLVYGNAIKNGADNEVAYHPGVPNTDQYCANFINHKNRNITAPWITKSTSGEGVDKGMGIAVTSAELLWQDAQGLITAVGIDGDYLTLTVGKDAATQEGNAIVAAKDDEGNIVWSWHIWVTKQTFSDLTEINAVVDETSHTYTVTPVNLGWVGEATSTTGYCTYYQWGRKDPFIPSTGTGDTNHTVYNIDNEESTGLTYSTSNPTIANNIKNPTKHYYYSRTQGPCTTKYNNMWDAQGTTYLATTIKTVYDPCPPGFCVPDIGLYDYISSQTKSEWNTGYTYNGVFFPASGCRGMWEGALFQVGSYGYYWSFSPIGDYSAGTLFFTSESWNDYEIPRAFGCPVRAVAED